MESPVSMSELEEDHLHIIDQLAAHGALSPVDRRRMRAEIQSHCAGSAECRRFFDSERTRLVIRRLMDAYAMFASETGEDPQQARVDAYAALGDAVQHVWFTGSLPRPVRTTILAWLLGEIGVLGREAWASKFVQRQQDPRQAALDIDVVRSGVSAHLNRSDHNNLRDPRLTGDSDTHPRPLFGRAILQNLDYHDTNKRNFDARRSPEAFQPWRPGVLDVADEMFFMFSQSYEEYMDRALWPTVENLVYRGIAEAPMLRTLTVWVESIEHMSLVYTALMNSPVRLERFAIIIKISRNADVWNGALDAWARVPALKKLKYLGVEINFEFRNRNRQVAADWMLLPHPLIQSCQSTLTALNIHLVEFGRTLACFPGVINQYHMYMYNHTHICTYIYIDRSYTYTNIILSSRQSPPIVDNELDQFQQMLPAFPLLQTLTLVFQRSNRESGRSLRDVNLDWNPAAMPALRGLRFWSDEGTQPCFEYSQNRRLERLELYQRVASRSPSIERIQQKLAAMPICDELVDHNILRQCSSPDDDGLSPNDFPINIWRHLIGRARRVLRVNLRPWTCVKWHYLHRHWYFLQLQHYISALRKDDREEFPEIVLHVDPILLNPKNLSPELVELMAGYPVHRIRLTDVAPPLKPTVYQ